MANDKYKEIQALSDADLKAELVDVENQYQKLQFDHVLTGLDNPIQIRGMRRDIARLKTEIRKRELGTASEEALANRSKIRSRRRRK